MTRRKGHSRGNQGRPLRKTILIVCEGRETERNYLDGLKRVDDVARSFTITVQRGRGGSREQIVSHAVDCRLRKKDVFDETWCVMDVEANQTESSRADLRRAVDLATKEDIRLTLSNPSLEVWLLAHFVRSSRSFRDADALIVELNKHWQTAFSKDYAKADDRIFELLESRTQIAGSNAEQVRERDHPAGSPIEDCNSATEMYRLVRRLWPNPRAGAES